MSDRGGQTILLHVGAQLDALGAALPGTAYRSANVGIIFAVDTDFNGYHMVILSMVSGLSVPQIMRVLSLGILLAIILVRYRCFEAAIIKRHY